MIKMKNFNKSVFRRMFDFRYCIKSHETHLVSQPYAHKVNYQIRKYLSPFFHDLNEMLDFIRTQRIFIYLLLDFNKGMVRVTLYNRTRKIIGEFSLGGYNFAGLIIYFEKLNAKINKNAIKDYEFPEYHEDRIVSKFKNKRSGVTISTSTWKIKKLNPKKC